MATLTPAPVLMRAALLAAGFLLVNGASVSAQRPVRTPPPRPPAPAAVTAAITGPAEVTITWDAVPDARAYHLGFHSPPDGWRRVAEVGGTTTSYVHTGRDLTRTHQYSVVAVVGSLASPPQRSNVTVAQAARGDTTTVATTPTVTAAADTTPWIFVREPAVCHPDRSNPDRTFCSSERKDFTPQYSGDIFVRANCPEGFRLVSGGHSTLLWGSSELRHSYPDPQSTGWTVWVQARRDLKRPPMSIALAHALCERKSP